MMKYHLFALLWETCIICGFLLFFLHLMEVCFTLRLPSETLFVVAGVRFPFRGGKSVRLLTNPEMILVILLVTVVTKVALKVGFQNTWFLRTSSSPSSCSRFLNCSRNSRTSNISHHSSSTILSTHLYHHQEETDSYRLLEGVANSPTCFKVPTSGR